MFNPNLKIGAFFSVRAIAPITTSYVAGNVFSMEDHNALGLDVIYTKGTETTMEIKIETSNDNGLNYFQETAQSTSGGTVTKSLAERAYSATGNYSELLNPMRAKLVRVSAK